MSDPTPYRIEVTLRNGDIQETEPMSEDVARQTFESLQTTIRVPRNPDRMVRVGPNLTVRRGQIEYVKLVPVDEEFDPGGDAG